MRNWSWTFIILFMSATTYCYPQDKNSKFNFDFEFTEGGHPTGWNNFGSPNYILSLDSIIKKSGKYSACIEYREGKSDFKAWAFTLPENYAGKAITLTGYIKTESVTDGYSGLWMRIDPLIAFDNMNKRPVKGTTDWTKYEITLEMDPAKTKQIVIGGLLVGKGKIWLDNFSVSVDGRDIKNLKPFERKLYPAETDKEFEKGSGIITNSIEKSQIDNLKHLGLIWGFLKYYHPNIAKGEYNWDNELFRTIPKILNSGTSKSRDSIFIKWIEGLGKYSPGKEVVMKSSEVKIEPDLDWINNFDYSQELKRLLVNIKNAKRPKEHYYIGLQAGIGNPDFKNENSYSSMKYPDAGFRILALYRYWNIIQYYFPYKNLIEEDWKIVLEEFIPKFIESRDDTDYTLTVLELIGRVHDTHANIWGGNQILDHYFGTRYASVELTFIEGVPVVKGFYDEGKGKLTGLEIGDVISAINNKPVKDIIQEGSKFCPASNSPTKLRDLATKLLRTNDSIIYIEFSRDGKKQKKTLKTYSIKDMNIYNKYQVTDSCFRLINKEIAYINNGSLKREYLPKIWKEFEKTKGLIIDIRNYPSDFPIDELSSYLIPQSSPFVKFTNGSIEKPGLFTFTKALSTGGKNKSYYKGKVIILINEMTQSSAEFHAMAYRLNPNATVIGSTTAGADGNVSQFYLPGGISTMISGIGVYYPDGKETQRVGIVPDIKVKPTIQGIKNGEDELMNKAIKLIYGQ